MVRKTPILYAQELNSQGPTHLQKHQKMFTIKYSTFGIQDDEISQRPLF